MRSSCFAIPFAAFLLSGCPETPPLDEPPTPVETFEVEDPIFSGTFEVPSRADFTNPGLPVGPEGYGQSLGSPNGLIQFWYDDTERNPKTAAAECLVLIIQCIEPGVRNVRGCFDNVPFCATKTPWEPPDEAFCCPETCGERYAALRAAGMAGPAATSGALLQKGSCMPGFDAWRESL